MTVTSIKRGLKKTGVLSKIENGLVTCQIEAKTYINIGFFRQKCACRAKKGCFTIMQSFVTIAKLHPC